MRIDIVSIFPEFFGVLDISLLGKAREKGIIELGVHDLRDFTHDRHRTVDDTPYGGGAGMVMKPEPWGEAIDAILGEGSEGSKGSETPESTTTATDVAAPVDPSAPVVIFPSPAGLGKMTTESCWITLSRASPQGSGFMTMPAPPP